ncbi:hypothetical protein AK812_SmicGene5094 [Symbiodinium microadriaticum]|uniref:Uncharacterized protein n=1 Tax=Symbiodinium microadriaticum TaxID=2951 RepID=A0A1Q9EUN1_SYMMI|nr:hypothetical protein AK812_SmicGene5094 [Symbiodinium microadriaticum]
MGILQVLLPVVFIIILLTVSPKYWAAGLGKIEFACLRCGDVLVAPQMPVPDLLYRMYDEDRRALEAPWIFEIWRLQGASQPAMEHART